MSANFTSGWLGHNQAAWHGMGVVTPGALPARTAFETAEALFHVEKRELQVPTHVETQSEGAGYLPARIVYQPSGAYGLVRTDTQALLGIVSKQYEIVQTEALLRMAEFIREEVDMDSVVVLASGAKVAFTATLRGATQDVVPGDSVKRRIVGYLGHDGKTGCGAIFTNVRVVCCNTLAAALGSSNKQSITHKGAANSNFDALIQRIDAARETFLDDVETLQRFADVSITRDDFRAYLEEVYAKDIPENKSVDDLRKYGKLVTAYQYGLGAEHSFGTLWGAVNAVTEVETSTMVGTRAQRNKTFAKANFGTGLSYSQRAIQVAKEFALV